MLYPLKNLFVCFGICVSTLVFAQQKSVLFDNFSNQTQFKDLSLLTLWGNNTTATSAWQFQDVQDNQSLTYRAAVLSDTAIRYNSYTIANGLKTLSCLDYTFPTIDRMQDSIKIEFDVLWKTLSSGGESNRIVFALMHEYPSTGPQFGDIDSIQKPHAFGRPAYNFRILGRRAQGNNNYAFTFYGGGADTLGEFEKTSAYWLPGFISGPGSISPSASANYPLGPVAKYMAGTIASATQWQHYTWILYPERIEVYRRNSQDDSTTNQLVHFMSIPKPGTLSEMLNKINTAHGTQLTQLPSQYHWFQSIKGLRVFQASTGANSKIYVSNISVKSSLGLVNDIVSVNDSYKQELKLIPNPGTNSIQLTTSKKMQSVRLFDLQGKMVVDQILHSNQNSIDFEFLSQGMYLVEVTFPNGEMVRKKWIKS